MVLHTQGCKIIIYVYLKNLCFPKLFSTTTAFHSTPYALLRFFTPTPKSAFGIYTTRFFSSFYKTASFCCFTHGLYYSLYICILF